MFTRFKRIGWFFLIVLMFGSCGDPLRLGPDPLGQSPSKPESQASTGADVLPPQPELLPPDVSMPIGHQVMGKGRSLPITLTNLKAARLRYAALSPADIHKAERVLGYHGADEDPFNIANASWVPSFKEQRLVATGTAATEELRFDVFKHIPGPYALVVVDAPHVGAKVAVLQRGALHVLMKLGDENGLLWVMNEDGSPASGASVRLTQGDKQRFTGRTDQAGILRLPGTEQLHRDGVGKERNYDDSLLAFAELKTSMGFSSEHWSTGVSPWEFGIDTYDWESGTLVGTVTAERGLYRPGDKVHLLGMMRKRATGGLLVVPDGKVGLTVRGTDDELLVDTRVQLTRFGTFRHEFTLPNPTALGRYQVEVKHEDATLYHRFQVGKYRAASFEVLVAQDHPRDPQLIQDKPLQIPVQGRYLYGAALREGKVQLEISAREANKFDDGFEWSSGNGGMRHLHSAEAKLDKDGKHTFEIRPSELLAGVLTETQQLELVVEATVTDEAGDTITGHKLIPLARSPVVVGLRSDVWVLSTKDTWRPLVKTLATNGKVIPSAVDLTLIRNEWISVAVGSQRGVRHSGHYEQVVVEKRKIRTLDKPVATSFKTPSGGRYTLRAQVAGRSEYSEVDVWVYGEGSYGRYDDHPRVTLHADKASYKAGETAKLLVESPYEKAVALVTLEREGVQEAFVQQLSGAGTPILLKLTEKHLPNIYASVALFPLGGKLPDTTTPLRVGYKNLTLNAESRRLKVAITPRETNTRPGTTVPVDVQVTDPGGKAVRAEVTLWAADQGVLQLTGYQTPDVFSPVYKARVLSVFTSASLLRFARQDYYDGNSGGDAAPPLPGDIALRSKFLDTAFFSKGVVTDDKGYAQVQLPLPDNLTRWKVIAAAADRTERFGSGDSAITVSKPIQITPALPRFLSLGDAFEARLMIRNNSEKSGSAQVTLNVANAQLSGPAQTELKLGPNEQKMATFRVTAHQLGQVTFRGTVRFGAETDGFEWPLPVHDVTERHIRRVFDGPIAPTAQVPFALPAEADPEGAELTIEVAPSRLASLGAAVDSLIDYPHGCLEQTTSRLIPMTLLSELLGGHPALTGKRHDTRMQGAVQHLLRNQNEDGGFSLWEGGESDAFLTSYALFGLSIAKQHGYVVPEKVFARGAKYVSDNATADIKSETFSGVGEATFVAFSMARLGRPMTSLTEALYNKRAALSTGEQAFLSAAMPLGAARSALTESLLQMAKPAGGGAKVLRDPSAAGSYFYYGAHLRATAALVAALVEEKRLRDAEPLVDGILSDRNAEGNWGTTFNNQWALFALGSYYRAALAKQETQVEVWHAGSHLVTLHSKPKEPLARHTLPLRSLANARRGTLELRGRAGADLGAVVRLSYADQPKFQKPVVQGFAVERSLADPTTGATIQSFKVGQLVRVTLRLTGSGAAQQVALVDRLPAGFEPVDTSLATARSAGSESEDWHWVHREMHDERVAYFAHYLSRGTHEVSYLAQATRPGTFLHPAPRAEAMYAPDVYGTGKLQTLRIDP